MATKISRRNALLGLAALATANASIAGKAEAQTQTKEQALEQALMPPCEPESVSVAAIRAPIPTKEQALEQASKYLSDPETQKVLRMWRNHLRLYIGQSGELLAGWGYPQSVPHMESGFEDSLSSGNADLVRTLAELSGLSPTDQ